VGMLFVRGDIVVLVSPPLRTSWSYHVYGDIFKVGEAFGRGGGLGLLNLIHNKEAFTVGQIHICNQLGALWSLETSVLNVNAVRGELISKQKDEKFSVQRAGNWVVKAFVCKIWLHFLQIPIKWLF
jgi:hypothetical protein